MAISAYGKCCNVLPRLLFGNEAIIPPAAGSTSRCPLGINPLYEMPQLKKTASPKIMPPSKGSPHPMTSKFSCRKAQPF